MKKYIPLLLATLCGCANFSDKVIVTTGTVLGVQLAENPATQLYEAKLGYARAEFVVAPTNGVPVLTELRINNIFSFTDAGIYQRTAIGSDAVKASMPLFLKNPNGTIDPNALKLIRPQ